MELVWMTWNDLADYYEKKTGRRARIQPISVIYKWALRQPELTENEDGVLCRIEEELA